MIRIFLKFYFFITIFQWIFSTISWAADFNPAVSALVKSYSEVTGKSNGQVAGFNAERGKEFFFKERINPKGIKDSCTSCHTSNLKEIGKTSAGKPIDPMAPSVNPKRLTDPKDIEKWFTRNCKQVLGRECTPQEKGDVLTFLITQ
ncbi:MAG: DUF1924 domain-containing protein [Nitrospiria bacterium]